LRPPDFFDAVHYPLLRFESTKIEALDDEDYRITGTSTSTAPPTRSRCTPRVQGTDVDRCDNERIGLEVTASPRAVTTT
jgi:hypothetical protein